MLYTSTYNIEQGLPMKTLLLTLSLLLSIELFAHEWQVHEQVYPRINYSQKVASVTNEHGDRLTIYNMPTDGTVWASLEIANSGDYIKWSIAPVIYIDKFQPIKLDQVRGMQDFGLHSYDWIKNRLNFRIWHGQEEKGLSNTMIKIMSGHQLLVKYTTKSSTSNTAKFTLKGADTAISEALSISPSTDIHEQVQKRYFNIAVIKENTRCRLDKKNSEACLQQSLNCSEIVGLDIQLYTECLKQ